jgi:ribose 5-phosphate isomerase B
MMDLTGHTIAVGADHAGLDLKTHLVAWLTEHGAEVRDFGTEGPASVDYPDFAHAVAAAVGAGEVPLALLVCGTGVGMSMTANRHPGVRAVVCSDAYSARMARAHNDANVLCLGARVVGTGLAEELMAAFLRSEFEAGRHRRRVDKIDAT